MHLKQISIQVKYLSARIPPKGESRIVGISAIDRILANTVAEPVVSSTYMYNANFII